MPAGVQAWPARWDQTLNPEGSMDSTRMLEILNEYGEEAGGVFRDGEEDQGWFDWAVMWPDGDKTKPPRLRITYKNAEDVEILSEQYQLVLIRHDPPAKAGEPS